MRTSIKACVPILYMVGILALSSIPGNASSGEALHLGSVPPKLQNALHVPLYALLTLLWLWAAQNCAGSVRVKIASIACFCIGFAIVDELYQTTIHGRDGSVSDVGLDTLGICLCAWLVHRFPNSIPYLSTFPKSPEPATIQR